MSLDDELNKIARNASQSANKEEFVQKINEWILPGFKALCVYFKEDTVPIGEDKMGIEAGVIMLNADGFFDTGNLMDIAQRILDGDFHPYDS